jgi:hypothetical protein
MEQNRTSSFESTQLQPSEFLPKRPKAYNEEKIPSSKNDAGKIISSCTRLKHNSKSWRAFRGKRNTYALLVRM